MLIQNWRLIANFNLILCIVDTEIPEGVDPSFLAALPEHIRQEVILEQLRLQRIRRRAQEQSSTALPQCGSSGGEAAAATAAAAGETSSTSGEANTVQTMEVNPEFLAALPLAIQEEVSFAVLGHCLRNHFLGAKAGIGRRKLFRFSGKSNNCILGKTELQFELFVYT